MRQNRILEKVRAGEAALGGAMNIYSPNLVELVGSMGFDWVFIDCEHGSMNESQVEEMVRAADVYGIAPVVRVPTNSASVILRYLDLGAMGIVVPHVDNKADAEAAGQAAKYPPVGIRGSNYGTGRNNEYGAGLEASEYYEKSNSETILFALIESGDGVENIDDIVATTGVDATWLGPADMALSMGMPGPDVIDEALDRVVRTTVEAGKLAAVTHLPASDTERLAHFHELGAKVLAVNAFGLLREAGGSWLETVRRDVVG